jgi:hypothetical protein
MPLLNNGPELWDAILEDVRRVVPAAVIAGGCVRDYRLGLAPKDIDIFVWDETRPFEEVVDDLNEYGLDFDLKRIELAGNQEHPEYERWSAGELAGCAEGWWGHPQCESWYINIIARRDLRGNAFKLIDNFDMGIVQCYYDADLKFTGTPWVQTEQCGRDNASKHATLMRADTIDQSIARFERFNKRNPGVLTLVNPFPTGEDIFA